jgi:hypothetical protein
MSSRQIRYSVKLQYIYKPLQFSTGRRVRITFTISFWALSTARMSLYAEGSRNNPIGKWCCK